jgi:hypothetical protein
VKSGLLTIGLWVLAGLALIGVSWALLVANRPIAKYAEETRRQTFETSRAHQSGVNSAIADYCLNMQTATDDTQRRALARWIINEAATFKGPLTSESSTCLADARAALN